MLPGLKFLQRGSNGNRQDREDRESAAGAVPANATGSGGAESNASPRTSEYVGWRSWRTFYNALYSINSNFCWKGPVVHADQEPRGNNTNGIYAVFKPEETPVAEVWGEIALSDVVVVGEKGYRGAVATVRSIYVGEDWRIQEPDGVNHPRTFARWPSEEMVREFEKRYQVEVRVVPSRISLSSRL